MKEKNKIIIQLVQMIQDFLSHTNCVIVWIVNLTNHLLEVDLFKWVCLFRLSTGVVLS